MSKGIGVYKPNTTEEETTPSATTEEAQRTIMPEFRSPRIKFFDPGEAYREKQQEIRSVVYGEAPLSPLSVPAKKLSKKEVEDKQITRLVGSLIAENQSQTDKRNRIREAQHFATIGLQTISPNEGYTFEQSHGEKAEIRRQDFLENDPSAAFIQPDRELEAEDMNAEEPLTPAKALQNTVNFLFSDEMGLLGMKWDDESFTWAKENFVNQITEHPISTSVTLASYLVPIGLAWQKGARIAARGAKFASLAGEDAAVAAGKGILGTNLGFKFDDEAKLIKVLTNPAIEERKLFSDSTLEALKKATTPEEIKAIVPKGELNQMLLNDWHQERFFQLRQLAKEGKLETIKEKASWAMWRQFGNTYMRHIQDMNISKIDNMHEFFQQAQLGRYLAQAPTRLGDEGNKAIYMFWKAGTGKRDVEALAKKVGKENAEWAEQYANKAEDLFVEQYKEGFIDYDTVSLFADEDKVGAGFHLPAILKGTAGFEEIGGKFVSVAPGDAAQYGSLVNEQGLDVAKAMTGATTMHRGKFITSEAILDNIDALETNPYKLTVGGLIKDSILFQIHRNFRDIIVDAVGKGSKSKWVQSIKSRADYDALPKSAQKSWLDFDELDSVVPGLRDRMRRMVDMKVREEGLDPIDFADMPVIDRELVKTFFGRDGSARQVGGTFSKFFELLTAVHKTSRTALNVPTHMSNIVGNLMFLSMAGMNPFGAQAINDGKAFASAFHKIGKMASNRGDETVKSLMTVENLAKAFGKDRYAIDKFGEKIDFAEMFAHPAMKELIEAQAFDEVEGLKHVHRLLGQIGRMESSGWSDKALETTARTIAGVGEVKGIKQTLQAASSLYLGEDMVPKMMYAAHLARKGWGTDSIIREVGRRLPQYADVGHIQKSARRIVLPWITFPAESARIMKNNMMDRPVQMMAWLQAPAVAQSMVSGLGMGPDFKDMEASIDAAQPWAVRYQTVMVNGEDAAPVLGAVGGAGVGGVIGGALGGAKGAATGAVGGAISGAITGASSLKDEIKDFNRAWSLDWLPQSSIVPSSIHPAQWEKVLPTSLGGRSTPGRESIMTAKDLLPVEPFAVFTPLLELYAGRGSFGRDIKAKSTIDYAGKMALGLLGHLSPPIMQKYGMALDNPATNPVALMANIHDKNGGQSTLPKKITATFGGLLLGGLSFYGARTGLGSSLGASATSSAVAGAIGAGAGYEVNVSRLMRDLGITPDQRTGQYSNSTLDFFANSFFGLNKSWKTDPLQAEYSKTIRGKEMDELRGISRKTIRDAIVNGRPGQAKSAIAEVKTLYNYEYGDTKMADAEFAKWSHRLFQDFKNLPIFSGVSEKELAFRINSLKAAQAEAQKFRRGQLAELRAAFQKTQLEKAKGLTIVEEE